MSEHRGPTIAHSGASTVIDCEVCGWAHLDPITDPAELALMYEREHYQGSGWLAKDRSEKPYWDLEHADKLPDWAELVGGAGGRIVDLECSGGLLLEFAGEHGWSGLGIEPSTQAIEEARNHGVEVVAGLYQDVALEPASADVFHCKLVVEHLIDPHDYAAWSARLVRIGGVLSIHVPNDLNRLQTTARDALHKQDWVAPPFHINYFNFESLERLLWRANLAPPNWDATFPVEWFLLMGEDDLGPDEPGAWVHRRRMALESELEKPGLRRPLHAQRTSLGPAREAIVHAVKRAGAEGAGA